MRSQVNPGGNRYDLDGFYNAVAGTFTIDEIGLDLLSYSGQRLFCFRFDIKCDDDNVECSASLCIELPVDCTPSGVDGETPEVTCKGEQEGMKVYAASIPFKGKTPNGQKGYEVISSSFGAFTNLEAAKSSFATVVIFAPKGLTGSWLLFGDPDLKRGEIEMTDALTGRTFNVPEPAESDVICFIKFPDCDELEGRSSWSNEDSEGAISLSASLSVAPNPATDRLTIASEFPDEGSLNWESLQLIGVDGKLYSSASLVNTGDRAELLLQNLPPGWYSVSVLTDTGEPLLAYFIKQ